ncbi:MAG: hypothetical protein GX335_08560 [Firmicutes bacterium]|mgnify:CR=1 FL=1|nr:hypothetical protein [Bacillota bacterium]
MKQAPDFLRIEENMRTGPLAAHDFLGSDERSLAAIIYHDRLLLEQLGLTAKDFAQRMRYFSSKAGADAGPQIVDGKFAVERAEYIGRILCPFADNFQAPKAVITVVNKELGKKVVWSDLNVHLIEEHGFFEGEGAPFRIEPSFYAEVLEI